jgi:hypothetical protein
VTQTLATAPLARRLLADHFGTDPLDLPIVTEIYEGWDHVNLQAAISGYVDSLDVTSSLTGIHIPPPPGGGIFPPQVPSLGDLLTFAPAQPGSVDLVDVPSGPDAVMSCIRTGLMLIDGPHGKLAVWLRPDSLLMGRKLALDVQSSDARTAYDFLAVIRALQIQHNVFRGQVVKFSADMYGNVTVDFDPRPQIAREQLILSPPTIEAIEEHAIGVADAADELRAAGRHVKRGLLLYGPPGTGKTLTIRYIASRLTDATVFMLSGSGMAWMKFACGIAADLGPSVIVLDDVDLIAEDRNLGGMSPRRHMFDLLDAMDGLHENSDLLFICTTNRPETLEKAIAARPGRIDQAVAISLPDADCRRRLLELYGEGLRLEVTDVDAVIARTEGVTASFIRELLRKAAVIAVLGTADAGDTAEVTVTDKELHAALDSLLDPLNPLTAALLGGAPSLPGTDIPTGASS